MDFVKLSEIEEWYNIIIFHFSNYPCIIISDSKIQSSVYTYVV